MCGNFRDQNTKHSFQGKRHEVIESEGGISGRGEWI
jgi:hypothetical protein